MLSLVEAGLENQNDDISNHSFYKSVGVRLPLQSIFVSKCLFEIAPNIFFFKKIGCTMETGEACKVCITLST